MERIPPALERNILLNFDLDRRVTFWSISRKPTFLSGGRRCVHRKGGNHGNNNDGNSNSVINLVCIQRLRMNGQSI